MIRRRMFLAMCLASLILAGTTYCDAVSLVVCQQHADVLVSQLTAVPYAIQVFVFGGRLLRRQHGGRVPGVCSLLLSLGLAIFVLVGAIGSMCGCDVPTVWVVYSMALNLIGHILAAVGTARRAIDFSYRVMARGIRAGK